MLQRRVDGVPDERGYGTTAPVGSYPPNGHGPFDTAGNVWEWTADWYTARHPDDADKPWCVPRNPRGGGQQASVDPAQPQFAIARKVIKGGSFLCADSYCLRDRSAARRPQMIDPGMSHIGSDLPPSSSPVRSPTASP